MTTGTKRITVSVRSADQALLDDLVANGEARSVSAAFRLICDAYQAMQSNNAFAEVTRQVDHQQVLAGVGLLNDDQSLIPHRQPAVGPRWSALATGEPPVPAPPPSTPTPPHGPAAVAP